jgi:hypothetical protein
MLLIGHDLHLSCGLHVIGVFNLFEHYISLEIPMFDLGVGLRDFTCLINFSHVHWHWVCEG